MVAGTGVAQSIPFVFAPILTRLYSPEDFGVAALYLSLASILGILATLRFETAILQPKDDLSAYKLVMLCVLVAITLALLLSVALLLWSDLICTWLGINEHNKILYLLPLSMVLTAVFQAYNYWAIRKSAYVSIALGNTVQSTATPSVQILISGLTKVLGLGLIVGNVTGQAVATFFIYIKNRGVKLSKIDRNALSYSYSSVAIQYKQMPLFGLPGALLDATALQFPVLFMTKIFESSVVGYFSLVLRVLSIPARLISGSLSKLLLKQLSNIANSTTSSELTVLLILKTSLYLTFSIFPIVIAMEVWGQELFGFVFGDDWKTAGSMASIIVYAVAIRYIVSPLSSVLALKQHMFKGLCWQILYFITLGITLFLASSKSLENFLYLFLYHELILYTIYFFVILLACYQMDRRIV